VVGETEMDKRRWVASFVLELWSRAALGRQENRP